MVPRLRRGLIGIVLALVVSAALLPTPGLPVESARAFQYSNNAWTGTTARSNSTQSGLVVTITPTSPTSAITPVSSTLGAYGFTATNYSPPLPTAAATALFRTTAVGCAPSATPCTGRGTLAVTFEHPTRNPVLHLSGLGGYQQVGANQSQLQAQLTLTTPGLTLSRTAGANLTVSGNVIRPSSPLAGISCTTTAQGTAVAAGALGGCGSVQVNGLVTSVVFDLAVLNTIQAGAGVTPTGVNGDEFGVTVSFDEDFSDGPVSYDGGIAAPRSVLTDVVLGAGITADNLLVANASVSPINSATATGDTDDAFTAPFAPLRPGVTTTYTLDVPYSGASKAGTLCGWIDFNRNGVFLSTGVGEERECGTFTAGSGVVTLTWAGIAGLVAGDSFARFRIGYTSSQAMNALSNGDSGEIEDYLVPITNAAIELTKSAVANDVDGDGIVAAGETITYSFSVRNTGTVPVDVSVVDPLLGGSVPCGTGSLAPGATRACPNATYTVLQSDIGTTITNIATATGRPVSGSNASATASTSTPLPIVSRLRLDKTAGPIDDLDGNGIDAGDTITYAFTATNTGNTDLGSILLSDALLGLTNLPCGAGALAPGATRVCPTATYTVIQADVDRGAIDNVATVSGTPPVGAAVTASDNSTVTIAPAPGIRVVKSADVSVALRAGDVVSYRFDVTNTGNVTLHDVAVNDTFDPPAGPPLTITCPTTVLAPAASMTCTASPYTVTQADVDHGGIDNTAAAVGTPPTGPAVTDDDEWTVSIGSAASIRVVKSADLTEADQAGDVVNYSFEVTNTGNVTLHDVAVNDAFAGPAGPPLTITCPTTVLAPGASMTCPASPYTVTQADADQGAITNTATAAGTPPAGPAVTDADDWAVTIGPAPGVRLVKSADTSIAARAGDLVTYSFLVNNIGNVTLGNLTVTDVLAAPAGPALTISCPVTVLAPDASTTCTSSPYTVTQDDADGGTIANTATAAGTPPVGVGVTDVDDWTVTIAPAPNIRVAKTADTTVGGQVGDLVTYSFEVTNTGNLTLHDVAVGDVFAAPAGPPLAITCPSTTLAPPESMTCTAPAHVITQADVDHGAIDNTATATGTPPTGPDVSDDDDWTVTVPSAPSITIVKSTTTTGVSHVGDVIAYEYLVTNIGNVTLTDVTVDDSQAPPAGSLTTGPTCPSTTLEPGESTICAATYAVTQADLDHGRVDDSAVASGTPPSGPDVSSSPSTATVPALHEPAIAVVKSADSTTVGAAGDVINISFLVTNTGNVTLTHVTVVDTQAAPAGPLTTGPTCPQETLAPGATQRCTGTYAVTQTDIDHGTVSDTAVATGQTSLGTSPQVTIVSDDAALTVDVEPGSVVTPPAPGEPTPPVPTDPTRGPPTDPTLPATGTDTTVPALIAAAVLVAGLTLRSSSRRRRRPF